MNDYRWLNDLSQKFLENGYLLPGQTVDERVDIICNKAESILDISGYAVRLKYIIKKGWCSLSTPIWSNFGTEKGLAISCFGSYIEDNISSILGTHSEIGMMSKLGGGTSAYFGNLRPRGGKIKDNGYSHGSVHFMEMYNSLINTISQGQARRGSLAVFLPIEHGDIEEFLTIKSEGSPIQDLNFGVCVLDEWMESMIDGDMQKRDIWAKVIECRNNIGYPYIQFTDNANNGAPDVYKDKGLKISHTNMCSEIQLFNSEDESFVCDLSSMNILYFDEWKDTDAVEVLTFLLDAVMTDFIEKASKIKFMEKAVKFAANQRALGIGWLGWHSYLQSKMIAFESMEAKLLNTIVARTIKEQAESASKRLAIIYGEPPLLIGYGRRNTTLCAIAPTKSSAFILGQVSEGIEPHKDNYYIKDLAKGKYTIKNPALIKVLEDIGENTEEVWSSILHNNGSVGHLKCLSEHQKNVFKTFKEISQKEIIIQASARQKYIDQGQSLNLMIHPNTSTKDVNALLIEAWRLGVKSLYYQFSVNASQSFTNNLLSCVSCES